LPDHATTGQAEPQRASWGRPTAGDCLLRPKPVHHPKSALAGTNRP
jgi:hypothetical protein